MCFRKIVWAAAVSLMEGEKCLLLGAYPSLCYAAVVIVNGVKNVYRCGTA